MDEHSIHTKYESCVQLYLVSSALHKTISVMVQLHREKLSTPAYDASSKISSFKNESTVTIPIEDEKKYLVEFTPNDSDNPKNWSGLKKWTIVFAITLINICTGLAMTVYASIGDTLKRDTGASQLEYISGMTTVSHPMIILTLTDIWEVYDCSFTAPINSLPYE